LSFEERFNEITESLKEISTRLEKLEETKESQGEEGSKGEEVKPSFDESILEHRFKQPMIHLASGDVLETLEQAEKPAYAPPAYAPPKYPVGLYPVPKLIDLIKRLAQKYGIEITGTLKDLLTRLGEGVKAQGEAGQSLESVGSLPRASEPLSDFEKIDRLTDEQFREFMETRFPNRWRS